jgi:hypothetical protein
MVGAPLKTSAAPTPAPPLAKPKPASPARDAGSPRRPGRPATFVRIALTIWILWHFTGVFLAALSIGVTSDLVLKVSQNPHGPMQWYLDALYMNQGHSFFAPDVGPGHLIRYQLYDQSGKEIEKGEFPSRKEHWPRLLYHRYFMLADQSELPFDDKPTREYWQRKYLEAFGKGLLAANANAQTIRLQRYNHWPPPRRIFVDKDDKLLDPRPSLTDPKGYEIQVDVTVRRTELTPISANQSMNMNWQDTRFETARRWTPPTR